MILCRSDTPILIPIPAPNRYQSVLRCLSLASRCTDRDKLLHQNLLCCRAKGGGRVGGGREVVGACLCLCLRSLPFYLFFRTKPKRQKERKKEIMMGAQKYLPDDLDVKEQKDAHIGSDSRCDKKTDFFVQPLKTYFVELFGTTPRIIYF